jgi:hypothetical protein
MPGRHAIIVDQAMADAPRAPEVTATFERTAPDREQPRRSYGRAHAHQRATVQTISKKGGKVTTTAAVSSDGEDQDRHTKGMKSGQPVNNLAVYEKQ